METEKDARGVQPDIIGDSPAMQKVYERVARASATEATVLILGETGTGKELIAKAIHRQSVRSAGPFIPVNCGAIPSALIESALFGHEKGAYTGADQKKKGFFAAAVNGTIFLDELNSTDQTLQVKLLRVLQEKQITPVGANMSVPVDVRVIGAANKNLSTEVREGRFREDLYYRIAVLELVIPPLRERGDDVMLLAEHFLDKCAKRDGKVIKGFTPASADRFRQHRWPGNVRELQNRVERAVAWSTVDEAGLLEVTISDADLSIVSDSLNATPETGIAARATTVGDIADIVFNDLTNGQPALRGLRQGSKEIGSLARLVIEGLVDGYDHYLTSDKGQKDLANFPDGYLITQIGLGQRKGGSGESVFNSELRRLIGQLLASHRDRKERTRVT